MTGPDVVGSDAGGRTVSYKERLLVLGCGDLPCS